MANFCDDLCDEYYYVKNEGNANFLNQIIVSLEIQMMV